MAKFRKLKLGKLLRNAGAIMAMVEALRVGWPAVRTRLDEVASTDPVVQQFYNTAHNLYLTLKGQEAQ